MTTVGILGAGLSGIAMALQLRRAGFDDFVIYEEQPDVGGTWYRNTYPGLHCDIPSHLYCYTAEPNPDWSMVFAPRAEIQAYIRSVAEKWDLVSHIRFATRVLSARFDEDEGVWWLTLAGGGSEVPHRVLVSATGGLTAPNLPKVPGLDTFAGPSWHSAAWRHDVDLRGKRVAVVGSAASAVQVVPEVAKLAAEVTVFSRTPNWVFPRNNRHYTDSERAALQHAEEMQRLRRGQYKDSMWWWLAFRRHEATLQAMRERCLTHMRASITDPAVIDALTPSYPPGCNRLLLSDDYYHALAQPHVRLVPHGVTALSETAVQAADGSATDVDVVIFCTGYRLGGRADGAAALDVYGRGGETLRNRISRQTMAYRGVAVPGFPNWFTVCGINGTVAYGSLILSAEVETDYITRWVQRMANDGIKSVEAREDATEAYNEAIQRELSQMSWTGACSNFYRDARGRVVAFHPGTIGRMRRELADLHEDDFIVESR
ncbi:MAG: NAD(P)/FAD-dependent oxidoreductase [Acidimicrobiales bacterium]